MKSPIPEVTVHEATEENAVTCEMGKPHIINISNVKKTVHNVVEKIELELAQLPVKKSCNNLSPSIISNADINTKISTQSLQNPLAESTRISQALSAYGNVSYHL